MSGRRFDGLVERARFPENRSGPAEPINQFNPCLTESNAQLVKAQDFRPVKFLDTVVLRISTPLNGESVFADPLDDCVKGQDVLTGHRIDKQSGRARRKKRAIGKIRRRVRHFCRSGSGAFLRQKTRSCFRRSDVGVHIHASINLETATEMTVKGIFCPLMG